MANHLSIVKHPKIIKKVSKKNFSYGQGNGHKVESLLIKLIKEGKTNSLVGSAPDLERVLGTTGCKRLADYLETYQEEQVDGVGGVC